MVPNLFNSTTLPNKKISGAHRRILTHLSPSHLHTLDSTTLPNKRISLTHINSSVCVESVTLVNNGLNEKVYKFKYS